MMKHMTAILICIGASTTNADDSTVEAGKALHDQHCLTCHKPELYSRPDRSVTSRQKLSARVGLCEQQLQLQWFDEEIESVAEYLNAEYYHFK